MQIDSSKKGNYEKNLEMIKMENIITVIKKNAFCELIKRYDMAKERTSELEDRSVKL